MITSVFPLKKLRRNGRNLLFGAILVVGVIAVYHEFVAANTGGTNTRVNPAKGDGVWSGAASDGGYKGQANLHIFEDWCGSSIDQLHKNLHFPLYPHSRTTVQKLALSPKWTNYGLRIFGYLHPHIDGEFDFAVSSDDNSEFWLSKDDSPLNLQLLVWVGKTGTEWTAPGEFEKYASQTSTPIWLSAQRKYYFEVIHKQNDRGTDHVEVAWKTKQEDLRFAIIGSAHISLYTNESALLMSQVAHIPQTAASHAVQPSKQPCRQPPGIQADMLREDPRDALYRRPLISSRFLQGVLPDCSYKPSYIIKGYPLLRYQGLQFVHMTYIYPNDYTRLTHMETENGCFYHESAFYLKHFGFSRYMRLDRPGGQEEGGGFFPELHPQRRERDLSLNDDAEEEEQEEAAPEEEDERHKERDDNALRLDYGDDYDDYVHMRRRQLFSTNDDEPKGPRRNASEAGRRVVTRGRRDGPKAARPAKGEAGAPPLRPLRRKAVQPNAQHVQVNPGEKAKLVKGPKRRPVRVRQKQKNLQTPGQGERPDTDTQPGADRRPAAPTPHPQAAPKVRRPVRRSRGKRAQEPKGAQHPPRGGRDISAPPRARAGTLRPVLTKRNRGPRPDGPAPALDLDRRDAADGGHLRDREIELNAPLQRDSEDAGVGKARTTTEAEMARNWRKEAEEKDVNRGGVETDSLWELGGNSDGDNDEAPAYDASPAPVFDPEVIWSQTFHVNPLDLQSMRSDWIDLSCNVSGNLLLRPQEAQSISRAFMDRLNNKHHGNFILVRVVNVEKREDRGQGSRYLLELEIKDENGQLHRLSHYVYSLIRQRRPRPRKFSFQRPAPDVFLCNPVGFQWSPTATVHFIVPVKNQARWVLQLISDLEALYRETRDTDFSLIITDYNSTDMDVEKALRKSSLPRYEYLKLSGNFERSAGLQAGIDLITDDHSIVFLCDLHIHFPPSIIESIRKHCVEGRMAFAPIVMRLNCGATPQDPRGYWEVNGFGLLGIYKSDLVAAGGMNTKEFTDRWGGEDWELLDRILQSGLEVERIYLRNFFHHYHSKRGMWNRRTLPNTR